MPKISIIIPSYNCGQYIGEAINSILTQTYKDLEVIVVDDGSEDNTKEALFTYIEKKLIRYIFQENRGPGAARNTGIKVAKGQYITFLDADDVLLPESIEKRCNFLDKHPNVFLVFGDYYKIEKSGKDHNTPQLKKECFLQNFRILMKRKEENEYIFEHFCPDVIERNLSVPLMSGSMMIKREAINKCGYFNERIKYGEGTHFCLKVANEFPVGYLDIPTWIYNNHRSNLSKNDLNKRESYSIERWVSLLEELTLKNSLKVKLKQKISKQCFDLGHLYYKQNSFSAAKDRFLKSIAYNGLCWRSYLYLFCLYVIPEKIISKISKQ
jgi:glycosyltransferase involved in cell wall biosynthesis